MPTDMERLKTGIAAGYTCLFGGRMALATLSLRTAILIGVIFLIFWPLSSFLASSTKSLREVYFVGAIILAMFCIVGFVSAYVRRLHDFGLRGYWAIVALIALPVAIIAGGSAYNDYRWKLDNSFNTADLNGVIGYVALIPTLLVGMWRGDRTENKFGPVPPPIEHALTSRFSVLAAIGAAIILVPTCIYAGLFQSGVWVGRGSVAPAMPVMESNVSGTRFVKCWNVKGVGAGSGEGSVSGVYRDGYAGNVFDFLLTPTGEIDIAMAGERGGNSYITDGFRIIPYGLKLPDDGSGYVNLKGIDRFMLVAIYDQGGSGAAINYTTFTFARNGESWPEYHVVLTTALSSPSNDLLGFPKARGKLMIGDCYVR